MRAVAQMLFLLTLALVAPVFADVYSANCTGPDSLDWTQFRCTTGPTLDYGMTATGKYEIMTNETGWIHMQLHSNKAFKNTEQAYALGFVQGYLEGERITAHMESQFPVFARSFKDKKISEDWYKFMDANIEYVKSLFKPGFTGGTTEQVAEQQAALMFLQAAGLAAGYEQRTGKKLDLRDVWTIQSHGDSYQIVPALEPKQLTLDEALEYDAMHTECSAFISVAADGADILGAHSTWTTYAGMLRVATTLSLGYSGITVPVVSYSSKPGHLHGKDDFAVNSAGLFVHETSISVLDQDTLAKVTPRTLLSWQREQAALRLGTDPATWATAMAHLTSGTYSNTWAALRMPSFHAGGADDWTLDDASFLIYEEVPGTHVTEDWTEKVRKQGWFASYNVPRTEAVDAASGNKALREKLRAEGREEDAAERDPETCTRALIFARELATRPRTPLDALGLIRQNTATDPDDQISRGNSLRAICARYDLLPRDDKKWNQYGCIDGKTTSLRLITRAKTLVPSFWAVAGPAWGPQYRGDPALRYKHSIEPFSWENMEKPEQHVLQPAVFAFAPTYVHAELFGFNAMDQN